MSSTVPKFDSHTTAQRAAEALSPFIVGKNVLITGPTVKGLGFEAARAIATQKPALLILAGRSVQALDEAETQIKNETPDANIRKLVLDLGSLEQVKKAAEEVMSYPEPTIDVLINNAGIMALANRTDTADGHEAQFGINHLGHFLFTNLIMPKIRRSQSPRIVNVSSAGHQDSGIRFNDPDYKEPGSYEKWQAYAQAKTANILFSVELAKRGLTSFSLHPGSIATPLSRHMSGDDMVAFQKRFPFAFNEDGTPNWESGFWKTLPEGAATHIVAAFDPSIVDKNGSYLADCQVANDQAKPFALDKGNAEKLWKLSEELVGQAF